MRRILYTEDDPDTRELVTLLLNDFRYEVVTSDSYQSALRLAEATQFDLYLIDSWLGEASGLDLCKAIRSFDPTTPILFFSGAAYDLDKQNAFDSGAQGYLTKPATMDDLVAEVVRLIGDARVVKSL
jgi:two-component system OmpR family response regulator